MEIHHRWSSIHTEPRKDGVEDGPSCGQDVAGGTGVPRSGGDKEGIKEGMLPRIRGKMHTRMLGVYGRS